MDKPGSARVLCTPGDAFAEKPSPARPSPELPGTWRAIRSRSRGDLSSAVPPGPGTLHFLGPLGQLLQLRWYPGLSQARGPVGLLAIAPAHGVGGCPDHQRVDATCARPALAEPVTTGEYLWT